MRRLGFECQGTKCGNQVDGREGSNGASNVFLREDVKNCLAGIPFQQKRELSWQYNKTDQVKGLVHKREAGI